MKNYAYVDLGVLYAMCLSYYGFINKIKDSLPSGLIKLQSPFVLSPRGKREGNSFDRLFNWEQRENILDQEIA